MARRAAAKHSRTADTRRATYPPLCRPLTDRQVEEMLAIRRDLQSSSSGLIRYYKGMPAGADRGMQLRGRRRNSAAGEINTVIDVAESSRDSGALHADMTGYRKAARRQMYLMARDLCSRPGPHPQWAVREVSRGDGVQGSGSGATATALDWLRRHAR